MKLIKEFTREVQVVRKIHMVLVECEICGIQEEKKKAYWSNSKDKVCKKCSRLRGIGIWKGKQVNHENIDNNELLEMIKYDFDLLPDGNFINKLDRGGSAKKGNIAGRIDKRGYRQISVYGKRYKAHHLVWLWHNGYLPEYIDHKNHVRTNNRIENLREVTELENGRNTSLKSNNTSGINGVIKEGKKWIAQIKVNGKNIRLGSFNAKEDAAKVRKKANKKYGFHENHGKGK